jgi:hypothetical protein
LKKGCRGGKPAINRLSYGVALPLRLCFFAVKENIIKKNTLPIIQDNKEKDKSNYA